MNLSNFRHGEPFLVRLRPCARNAFPEAPGAGVEVFIKNTDDNELLVTWPGLALPVYAKANKPQDHELVLLRLNQGWPCLASAIDPRTKNSPREILVEIRFLQGSTSPPPMNLGIDEKIHEQIGKRLGNPGISLEDACRYLANDFVLPTPALAPEMAPHGEHRWVVVPSRGREELTFVRFRLLGANHAIEIKRVGPEGDESLLVDKLIWKPKIVKGGRWEPLWLLLGQIEFVDATVGARLQNGALLSLDNMVKNSSSYLALWRRFHVLEVEKLRDQARSLGAFRYENCHYDEVDRQWKFKVCADRSDIEMIRAKWFESQQNLVFEASPERPSWNELFTEKHGRIPSRRQKLFSGHLDEINSHTNEVQLESRRSDKSGWQAKPPPEGWLYLAMVGDQARIGRRQRALDRIGNDEVEIRTLRLLLESTAAPYRRLVSEPALSKAARECFRGGMPTEMQTRAIRLALNTPDIAIIQGPPGTGKTRTIAAIVQRLNELADKEGLATRRYLLTSFQHDAVETVAAATTLMGLPTIKSGRKQRLTDQRAGNDHVDQWVKDLASTLEGDLCDLGDRPLSVLLDKVKRLRRAYVQSPGTADHAAGLMRDLAALISGVLEERLVEQCKEQARRLKNKSLPEEHDREAARRALEGLRTCPASFADDGPRMAHRLLGFAENFSLDEQATKLLDTASGWDPESTEEPEFIGDLLKLKERILGSLVQQGSTATALLANVGVCEVLEQVESAIEHRVSESPDEGPAAALESFVDELRQAPRAGRDAVERYSALLAATCQGCDSEKFRELMTDQDAPGLSGFDTVIVDEAARANPLDLLIPMSLAGKRVILVGDHRQLPHLLEPDVEKEISSSICEDTDKMIRQSLFQRLFDHAREMERDTGVQRCVTLDQQFRMHPKLAELVSRNFYEPHGESFESPKEPDFIDRFDHGLDGPETGKLAIWRSVPHSLGKEERQSGGFSWLREVEGRHVAEEANRLLGIAPSLSIGIITFYTAQVQKIMSELHRLGVAISDGVTGEPVIAPNFHTFPPGEKNRFGDHERLRVGTVDAFQGKEFDIVILSPVRSNRVRFDLGEPNPAMARRKFGHLLLPNRACVAMSRQRRLLIVVGDDGMFAAPFNETRGQQDALHAAHPVPGLPDFLKMCDSPIGLRTTVS